MPENRSYTQMRNEFYKKYNQIIVPLLRSYESKRKKNLLNVIWISVCFTSLGILSWYFVIIKGDVSNPLSENFLMIPFSLFGLASFFCKVTKKKFEKEIKDKIMPTVCSCFDNMKWSCHNYQGGRLFSDSYVISHFEVESYDDIFKGSYKDVDIDIVECEYVRGSGKQRKTVFDGVIVKLKMNKKFTSHTVIKQDHTSHVHGLCYTKFEDCEFNKKFYVYTNDETDARYLITPTFMERLKNMKIAFNAIKMRCSFYDKYLIVAFSTPKDLFSICSLTKPIDDSKQFFQMYEEVLSIIKLIDYFKLNQKIAI